MATYSKGDIVSINCVVKFENDETVFLDYRGSSVYAKSDDVTMVQPKYEVGEIVNWRGIFNYEIRGIEESVVWLRRSDGEFWSVAVGEIKRVAQAEPESELKPVEPPSLADITAGPTTHDAMLHLVEAAPADSSDDEEIVF